jgi:hypothetical protein
MSEQATAEARWEEAKELVRCVGASVSDLRIERVLEYGREREREALERAAAERKKLVNEGATHMEILAADRILSALGDRSVDRAEAESK